MIRSQLKGGPSPVDLHLQCDLCQAVSPALVVDVDDASNLDAKREMTRRARELGWTTQLLKGRWEDRCPACEAIAAQSAA